MTDYYYETEEEPAPPAGRRIRFDPTKERGTDYYDRAYRHSRWVRWLKILLPAVAAAGVASFFILMQMAPEPTSSGVISLTGVNVEDKSVEMEKPHISGFEGTRRSYQVWATKAFQDLANPKVVTLNEINARFGVGNGVTANVVATVGVYDGMTKGLVLKNGIVLKTSTGYRAKLEEADVNMEKGHLLTGKPVEISGVRGTIKANAMEIIDRGARVVFSKGVKVTYIPKDEAEEKADADKKPAGKKDKKEAAGNEAVKKETAAPVAAAPGGEDSPAPAKAAADGPT